MIKKKVDDVTYQEYYDGQNYVAHYPGQHSLKYDYDIILKNINKDAYILDIGCRGGETVKMFQDMGYKNAYGTDIGEEAKIKCIKNYGEEWTNKYFKVGDIQNGNPFNFKFDFITFSHTLEHLMQPEKGMNIIYDSLNDDGFLFIAVPSDYEDANGDIQMMLMDQGAQFHWIFFESDKDFLDFCESNGLTREGWSIEKDCVPKNCIEVDNKIYLVDIDYKWKIEKIEKDLSNNHEVAYTLKTANESINEINIPKFVKNTVRGRHKVTKKGKGYVVKVSNPFDANKLG